MPRNQNKIPLKLKAHPAAFTNMKSIGMNSIRDAVGNMANLRRALILAGQPVPPNSTMQMMRWRNSVSGEWLGPFLYALCVHPDGPKIPLADLMTERPADKPPRTRSFHRRSRASDAFVSAPVPPQDPVLPLVPAPTPPPVADPFADINP